jgi:transcriptional regulator with XRE-family HTH domain
MPTKLDPAQQRAELLRAFGVRVRTLRVHAGFSQEALAELAGVHRTYLSSVERGQRNISLANIQALADALGCPPHELLRLAKERAR